MLVGGWCVSSELDKDRKFIQSCPKVRCILCKVSTYKKNNVLLATTVFTLFTIDCLILWFKCSFLFQSDFILRG